MQRIRQLDPWAMAAGRALLGPVVLFGDRCGWSGFTLAAMVVSALLSDIFDGVLARRWRVDTAAVRLFDSMCDLVFYVCVGVALWLFQPQLLHGDLNLLYALLAIEAANFAANFAKFGKPASYHSYLAKTWGLMLATGIAMGLATGHAVGLMRIALWMGIASNIETIAMSLMLPVWRRDVKTIAEAWRIRQELCGGAATEAEASREPQRAIRPAAWLDRGVTWIWTAVVAGLSLMATSAFAAQPGGTKDMQTLAQETQPRGYWIDSSTGLMWASRDNGKDVTWKQAVKYCRKLRVAGYSDWRLATLAELEGIYDKNANAPGLAGGPRNLWSFNWHVRGNLFLTGDQWSGTQIPDDRGKPSGYVWRFDFNEGQPFDGDEVSFHTNKRALCARGPIHD